MTNLWQDILFGCRMLLKKPGFTIVAVLSLALGIGANTTIFSLVNATLLGSLTFPEPQRLVAIWSPPLERPQQQNGVSASSYLAWKKQSQSFEAVGAMWWYVRSLTGTEDGAPAEQIQSQRFTPAIWDVLKVKPQKGRLFTDTEDQVGAPAPVILLSHGFWQRKFAGDPNIVGKTMKLDGVVSTVIGVMPPDFGLFEEETAIWEPSGITSNQIQSTATFLQVLARLKPGVSLTQAQSEMTGIAAQLATADPARNKGRTAFVQPLQETYFGGLREPLLTLQGVVAFVLLIASANVAGLLLARSSLRRVEVAIRSAIGAGRWRIVRQLLTESVMLAILGGLLGVVLGWAGLRLFVANMPPGLLGEFSVDVRVLGFTALVSILTGLLFGVLPALQSSKTDLATSLKESGRSNQGGPVRQRLRSVLVTGQIALALVLLIGAGLMINSFLRLQSNPLGADPSGLLSFQFRFPQDEMMKLVDRYRGVGLWEINPVTSLTFNRVYEQIRTLPGVQSAAASSIPPLNGGGMSMVFRLEGQPARDPNATSGPPPPSALYFAITPRFFETLRIPIVRGRDFNDRDTASAPAVVIVNQEMANRYWPNQDPIGKRVIFDFVPDEIPREVVAVVGNSRVSRFQRDPEPMIYIPHIQQSSRWQGPSWNARAQMTFIMRSSGDLMALVPGVRRAVAEVDPSKPVASVSTVEEAISRQLQGIRLYTMLLGIFGGIAVVLSAVGIYGVMAYSVAQRTREIGIRMALGARSRDVLGLVFRQMLLMVTIGLVLGLAGSFALTRFLEGELWGVTATDPTTYVSVSVLLIVVALIACLIPTRRAVRVQPTIALRYE